MTTNLLATLLTVFTTNTTEVLPTHTEFVTPNPPTLAVCQFREVPDPNPSDKWLRTKIEKVRTLSVVWEDDTYTAEKRELISDLEVHLHLTSTTTNFTDSAGNDVSWSTVTWSKVETNTPTSHSRGLSGYSPFVTPCTSIQDHP